MWFLKMSLIVYSRKGHYGNLTASINQINTTRIMILKKEMDQVKSKSHGFGRVGRERDMEDNKYLSFLIFH